MNATVKDLLHFVNAPAASPPLSVASAVSEIGKLRLRLGALKLLSWMKMQKRAGKVLPLELDERYEWCRDLISLVKSEAFLHGVIAIEAGAIVLSSGLSRDEQQELLALVDTEYKPPLLISQ